MSLFNEDRFSIFIVIFHQDLTLSLQDLGHKILGVDLKDLTNIILLANLFRTKCDGDGELGYAVPLFSFSLK